MKKYQGRLKEFNLRILVCSIVLLLSACVTINIYFPAAATEKAADKIIDEIWQSPSNTSTSQEPATEVPPASNQQ